MGDVADPEAWEKMIEAAVDNFGKLTTLVHNAFRFKDHQAAMHDTNLAAVDRLLWSIRCEADFSPKGHQNIMDYQNLCS